MKKNFGKKNWMFPMPVLMIGTYNEDGTANMMNAAWGGVTLEDEITICIDTAHKTWANIAAQKVPDCGADPLRTRRGSQGGR